MRGQGEQRGVLSFDMSSSIIYAIALTIKMIGQLPIPLEYANQGVIGWMHFNKEINIDASVGHH
uniref:Uncharacterized protein n=1 Tax=Nelumbo nucifera TaxID=4432 RepID=A0A822YXX9_NELNU|nr:TPA_asm: hypothetical protein HUJ06_008048 [Nelumbo nucifera]